MEEPGEQCTVVFALIVTEPASGCLQCACVCVCGGGGGEGLPLASSVTILAKTTVHCHYDEYDN
jgi:hypothetical protein